MEKKISPREKFLVAGAKGMVGSAICRALENSGYGNPNNGGSILCPSKKELNYLDLSSLQEWFKKNKPSIVIIAAAKVGGILANSSKPADFIIENLKIQNNLIETSWKHGVKRLLFLGSSCIYPKHAPQPLKEEYLLTGPLEPTNECYAISKISGIKLCQALNIQYGFDAITLMPTNLYGTGDNYDINESHVLPALIRKFSEASEKSLSSVTCWGTGNVLREFLHVDDLARAVIFSLEYWDPKDNSSPKDKYGNPLYFLNIGTGKDITIKNLALKIANATRFNGRIKWDKTKPDGTPKKQLDIERILKLGWSPRIDLDEGISQTVSEFLRKENIRGI